MEQNATARHIEDYITTAMYSGLAVYLFHGEKVLFHFILILILFLHGKKYL